MKYILYRAPQGLDKNVRQHELVAVEYGGSGRISFAKRQRDMVCRCLVE